MKRKERKEDRQTDRQKERKKERKKEKILECWLQFENDINFSFLVLKVLDSFHVKNFKFTTQLNNSCEQY